MYTARSDDVRLVEKLNGRCHFNRAEIKMLIDIYREVCGHSVMDKATFIDFLQNTFDMTDDPVIERIFRIFNKSNNGKISVEEWIQGLSVFLCGTMEEKMNFCFRVYDLGGNGCISREDLYSLLKHRIQKTGDEDPEDVTKDFIDMIIDKMDYDRDDHLSFSDYKKSVQQEPLLLQAFGPCLPEDKVRITFLALFKKTTPKWR
ncbi:EF-hand calcium-binding domain-containing protein 1-like [Centruroides sculpturatus]|uniref:EF-hand calcium-binding domain-containing protein 1-like n=1 Tax=Centruroides sculpturatus TaxID=218467 RepID=UPI000C6CE35E|nr:EF-hand calcium-binding domain-containing protein 1-like [Centruroides sculpturatus]XP_023220523.1 EF-hand calcium-binding domain-containing protein 1-like [Centruroides sculpturatus]XP_023220524.1 EF-hand calcium-binding domain-containing protein 1-like [Centruroides sculpturatus]XP_023220525.1 EF-hand calcium-binding domain-containing protein 1-like [Centruroides sculpturatus]XP_023220527.1 EF-hand calcium-binding domain-containing protein 1-like [Centruroides sculpturatus]XP_023220528.1 